MKKRLALLLGVMILLTALFASCGNVAATKRAMRFEETGETHTFKISLSDFADDNKTLFKNYGQTFTQRDDDDKITTTKITAYKDDVINANEATLMLNADQIRPVDADGTYVMNISYEATIIRFTAKQVLYSQYEVKTLQDLGCYDLFNESELNVTNKEENPFANNEGRITLRSTTESGVVFANDDNQLPSSSSTANKGFYIGKTAQTLSDYKYETTYDFADKKVLVKVNGSEEAEERAISGNCIDANQLLLYIRSFDKSSAAFQDNPTVAVYDVTTNSVSTAAFGINRQFNLILSDDADNPITVAVNAVNSAVDGLPFIAQYNLPDLTANGSGYDYLPISGDKRPKYTTVKFRSGWYSYQLQLDDEYSQIIDAVKYRNETAQ